MDSEFNKLKLTVREPALKRTVSVRNLPLHEQNMIKMIKVEKK